MSRRRHWQITEAEIVNCKVSWLGSSAGNLSEGTIPHTDYVAEYAYQVDGVWYRRGMHVGDPNSVGERFEIEYDPDNPIRNSAPGQTFHVKDPGSWIPIGIGGVLAWMAIYLKRKYS